MTVSRNRADYSPETHQWVAAISKVFLSGDIDVAWEEFFKTAEAAKERDRHRKNANVESARVHLRIPRSQ
jgi:hypothetical protein